MNPFKIVDIHEAYEDLANAVIVQAVKDYKFSLNSARRNPDSKQIQEDIKKLEGFFRSDWFQVLTNLDGSYIIRKIKEEC